MRIGLQSLLLWLLVGLAVSGCAMFPKHVRLENNARIRREFGETWTNAAGEFPELIGEYQRVVRELEYEVERR